MWSLALPVWGGAAFHLIQRIRAEDPIAVHELGSSIAFCVLVAGLGPGVGASKASQDSGPEHSVV